MTLQEWWAQQDLGVVRKRDLIEVFPDEPFNVGKHREIVRRIREAVEQNPEISPKQLSKLLKVSPSKVYQCYRKIYDYTPKHQVVIEALKKEISELKSQIGEEE